MSRPEKAKTHKLRLNQKQWHLLKMCYKFRFVTAALLARYKKVRVSAVNKSLVVLVDAGYLGRKYDKDYRIQGKGAVYYLTPKSLALLKDLETTEDNVLHAQYKNKTASSAFIDQNLNALSVYLSLRNTYPETFHIFTKPELAAYGYFPLPRPTLYLNRVQRATKQPNEYMLELFPDTQFFVIKKRLDALVEHFDSGDWEAGAETEYPTILLVAPDARTEQKLQDQSVKIFDNSGIDDLTILTTTLNALKTASQPEIWSDVNEPGKLAGL